MVGELSKYQKATGVTTNDSRWLKFNHNLGVTPKIVIITNENEHDATSTLLKYFILSKEIGASETYTGAANGYNVYTEVTTLGNGRACLLDSDIEVRQAASNRNFSINDSYTIELYA